MTGAGAESPASEPAAPPTRSSNRESPAPEAPVRITHPERVIDAKSGATKRDLVDWYLHAAHRMLPHLAGRPVALVRAPAGVGKHLFFQKHAGTLRIEDIHELPEGLDPGHPPLLEIDSFIALISAAQMNVVEFHTWNANAARIEKPDRIVFDLDPGEGLAWRTMQDAARLVRRVLEEELGLAAFLKTSGGKGLHVVVPLVPKEGWDAVKDFARAVVERLAALAPQAIVAKSGPKNRVGRIFVDYLRNTRGATTAAAFSARARPGLGVSIPCAWDELDEIGSGDHWTVRNGRDRLGAGTDPWSGYAAAARTLTSARKALRSSAAV
jgi:bifunctional non-homologous end joining protein LigD